MECSEIPLERNKESWPPIVLCLKCSLGCPFSLTIGFG